jgi:signal transduction histidine kinase
MLNTDRGLLHRVLGNMILNAIEASSPEEVVSVSCGVTDGYAEFRVHNEGHIPKEIQLRLFQRSFSTKGAGHGLGTYSMKLLSERYLNGRIGLSSSPQLGTTFVARYPL